MAPYLLYEKGTDEPVAVSDEIPYGYKGKSVEISENRKIALIQLGIPLLREELKLEKRV